MNKDKEHFMSAVTDTSIVTPPKFNRSNKPNLANSIRYQQNIISPTRNHDSPFDDIAGPSNYELSNMNQPSSDEFNFNTDTDNSPVSNQSSDLYNPNVNYKQTRNPLPSKAILDRTLPPTPYFELSSNPYDDHKVSRDLPTVPVDPFDDSNDIEKKLKINEKNRIKNMRRLPRFHWTKLPYFTIVVTLIQLIVFIVELVRMAQLTGSAFQTKPYFNPMLGPSTYLLINMGARYIPCMHQMQDITTDTSILFPCANSTDTDTNVCNLSQLCGLSTIPQVDNMWIPHQWYRIFIPIFLHAGFLHILFNLLLQVTMGASVERHIGILKYAIIYILSGIGGFLLGSNFTPTGIASTGASGALFGILATNIVMFVYCGKKNTNMYGTKHYGWFIVVMVSEIVVSLVLGLLPGLDNFSHIGGFAIGLLTALILLPDPFFVYIDGIITYDANVSTIRAFKNNWNPLHNYNDKIPRRVFIWIAVRVISLVLLILYFAMLAKNFFVDDADGSNSCSWCKYINCIPVNGWCDIGEVSVSTSSGSDSTATPSTAASSSTQPATTTAASTSTSGIPTAIVNGNEGGINGGLKKRNYDAFSKIDNTQNTRSISSNQDSFVQHQNMGISFYFLIMFLSFAFYKKRRSNTLH